MLNYPAEWLDEEQMSKSVADAPRSLAQKVGDFVFGRTPSERFTNAFTSLVPLKVSAVDKTAQSFIAPAMQWIEDVMRKQKVPALGPRMVDFLFNHPREMRVHSTPFLPNQSHLAGEISIPESRLAPYRIFVNPERDYPHRTLAHEFTHGIQDINYAGFERPEGVYPTLSGWMELFSRYPSIEREGEVFPHLFNEMSTIKKPELFVPQFIDWTNLR